MSAKHTLPLLTAACLALSACGGHDSTTEAATFPAIDPEVRARLVTTPATTAPRTTVPVSTAPPPVETTALATTAPPAITAPSAPATTHPADGPFAEALAESEAAEQIIAAAEGAWRTLNEAYLDPWNDQKLAALAEFRTGDNLVRATASVQSYRDENLRGYTYEPAPAMVRVVDGSMTIDVTGGFATLRTCGLDTNTTVAVGGNLDGTDLVTRDGLFVVVDESDYVVVDGRWKRTEERLVERTAGTTCD